LFVRVAACRPGRGGHGLAGASGSRRPSAGRPGGSDDRDPGRRSARAGPPPVPPALSRRTRPREVPRPCRGPTREDFAPRWRQERSSCSFDPVRPVHADGDRGRARRGRGPRWRRSRSPPRHPLRPAVRPSSPSPASGCLRPYRRRIILEARGGGGAYCRLSATKAMIEKAPSLAPGGPQT
jgi:hypothetical protein